MRIMWVIAAFAAMTMNAQAQEGATTPPAVPAPASSCPALVAAPSPPDGASATSAQVEAAVAAFEAWRVTEQATLDCRRAEVATLNAQLAARTNEYRAAQTDNTARGAAFQAQLDIYTARQRPRRTR